MFGIRLNSVDSHAQQPADEVAGLPDAVVGLVEQAGEEYGPPLLVALEHGNPPVAHTVVAGDDVIGQGLASFLIIRSLPPLPAIRALHLGAANWVDPKIVGNLHVATADAVDEFAYPFNAGWPVSS